MAGINLASQVREGKSSVQDGPASGGRPSIFNAPKLDFRAEDRIRALVFVFGVGSIFGVRFYVQDYTAKQAGVIRNQIATTDGQIAEEKKKLASLKDIASEADSYNKRVEDLQQKVNLVESLSKNRNYLVRMVDFTVSEMPGPVWLKRLYVDVGSEAKIEVTGFTTSLQLVGEFVKRLEGAVFFPSWAVAETESETNTTLAAGGGATKGIPIPTESKRFTLNAKVVKP